MKREPSIIEMCEQLRRRGMELTADRLKMDAVSREYKRELDEWWDRVFAQRALRHPPTNPATHADKGEPL